MCVIIYKPEGLVLDEHTIQECFTANPDGAGVAIVRPNDTLVHKGIMSLGKLTACIHEHRDSEMVIHCRIATHGLINEKQTHPFIVSRRIITSKGNGNQFVTRKPVLFHNGMLSGYGTAIYSDTVDMVTAVLAYLPSRQKRLKFLSTLGSKFVYIHQGRVNLVGNFICVDGIWFSNQNHCIWHGLMPKKRNKQKQKQTYNISDYFDSF
jgi:predicted glutamine amidotransferase